MTVTGESGCATSDTVRIDFGSESVLEDDKVEEYLTGLESRFGLPAVDPVRMGADAIATKLS